MGTLSLDASLWMALWALAVGGLLAVAVGGLWALAVGGLWALAVGGLLRGLLNLSMYLDKRS